MLAPIVAVDVRMLNASGIGVYLKNVLPLIFQENKTFQIKLIGNPDEIYDSLTLPEDVGIIPYFSRIYSLRSQIEILSKIPKETNLLWVPHFNIPLFYRGKLLVTIHDLFHLAMPDLLGAFHKRLYAKLLFSRARNKAEAILTVSQFSRSEILKYLGGNDKNICVTYPGVDRSWEEVETGSSLHPNPYFLYIGNIKPHKNLKNLIKAFLKVSDDIECDLVIIGQEKGLLTPDSEILSLLEKGHSRIYFKGFLSFDLLKRYMKQAYALVFPSLYEGFGLPPLEAMACGTPVIAANRASIPEVCGDAALYFDPENVDEIAEKLILISSDKSLSKKLIAKGLIQSKKFAWEKCAEQTMEVINKVLVD